MTNDLLYVVVALCLACLLIGFVVGGVLAIFVYDRAASRTARLQRTGQPDTPERMPTRVPGGEFQPASVESEAQLRAYEHVIERGAAQMMELEPALSLEDARRKARHALDELGAFRSGAAGA